MVTKLGRRTGEWSLSEGLGFQVSVTLFSDMDTGVNIRVLSLRRDGAGMALLVVLSPLSPVMTPHVSPVRYAERRRRARGSLRAL